VAGNPRVLNILNVMLASDVYAVFALEIGLMADRWGAGRANMDAHAVVFEEDFVFIGVGDGRILVHGLYSS
jgi:hypothetical protein